MPETRQNIICKTLIHRFDSDPHLQFSQQNQQFASDPTDREFPLDPFDSRIFPHGSGKKAGMSSGVFASQDFDLRFYQRWFAAAMGGVR